MNVPSSPPPAYAEVRQTSPIQQSNPNWQAWNRKLIALEFTQVEAMEYAKLFVNNGVEISMIPELNDGLLKGIGIEKAGHRIRILRLQTRTPVQIAPQQTAVIPQFAVNILRCAWHPQIAASGRCYRCTRLMCLGCHRQRFNKNTYYCQNCYRVIQNEECVIL